MGVRLYPNTKNEASLETLAGVTPGTFARLRPLLEDRERKLSQASGWVQREEVHEAFYNAITRIPECDILDSFLTFGWGKFRHDGLAEGYSGSCEDVEVIRELFRLNCIQADPALCEGVHWC